MIRLVRLVMLRLLLLLHRGRVIGNGAHCFHAMQCSGGRCEAGIGGAFVVVGCTVTAVITGGMVEVLRCHGGR
uniref:Putative secreted peptide n=1 Tax=Anopheles braziliensis TaxID=58242 RepID=A0A2M3ZRA1_9DIPT